MLVSEENKEIILKFKMPYWPTIWLLFIGNFFGFVFLLPFLITYQKHLIVSLQHICAGIWGVTLIADVVLGFVCIAFFKVKLKPNGISCFNFWGIYSFVLWEEMRAIKIFDLFGLQYARVFFRDSKVPLWVPLFIKNRQEFSKALSEFAPSSNLLRQTFEQQN